MMTSRAVWRRVLRRLAPEDWRDSLTDDIDEAFAGECHGRSRLWAAAWYAKQFGGALMEILKVRVRRWRESRRGSGLGPTLAGAWRDMRYAIRTLRRSPGFAGMTIATLALGIGANTAIFSLIRTVLLKPLPYGDSERLVLIWKPGDQVRSHLTWLSAPEVEGYRRESQSLANVGAYTTDDANLTGGAEPERVHAAFVTDGMFDVLGVPALLGRSLRSSDAQPGTPAGVVVLGHRLWQRRFAGDPSIVGQSIDVNGLPRVVVGVMPQTFQLPLDYASDQPTELWIPFAFSPSDLNEWGNHSYLCVARLRDGVTPGSATSELETIENRWAREGHMKDSGAARWHRATVPIRDLLINNEARRPLLILLGAVVVVLLIACANVVNLMLARSDGRRREVLVRAALGASRTALVRQVLVESLVLSTAGAGAGLILAGGSLQALAALRPASLPRGTEISIDAGVLGFVMAMAVLTAVTIGIGPALRHSRGDLAGRLHDGGRGSTRSRAGMAIGRILVVGQLACSIALVVGAMLLLRTLIELSRVDLGFNPHDVLTAQVRLPDASYRSDQDVVQFYRQATERLESQPGVRSAAAIRLLPLSRVIGTWSIVVEGRDSRPGDNPRGNFQWVTPDYFQVMGLTLIRGRFLTAVDREHADLVAVLSKTMADTYWPDGDALGKRFKLGTQRPWVTVAGIVADTHHNGMIESPRAEMYLPHAQLPEAGGFVERAMDLVVRTNGDPRGMTGTVRAVVRELDPKLPIANVRTMDDLVAQALSAPTFMATLLGIFAALALVLAAIGTYATMSLIVAARTTEIGIRLALGAQRRGIFRLIAAQGLSLSVIGIAIGIAGAALVSRTLGALLYGVRPLDPATFLTAPVVLAGVALVACALPARHAARLDPIATLRGLGTPRDRAKV
jgi:predicted permease